MLSSMTLLELQVHLESSPDPITLAGYSYATNHGCTTVTDADAIVARALASESALHAILTKMYSPIATRWYPGSLVQEALFVQ